MHDVRLVVNTVTHERRVEPRISLADFLRDELGLTGTHLGCEQGSCGACTVLVDGRSVRSCLLFAAQLDGATVDTVEGLEVGEDTMNPLQDAFARHAGLQCGFCTPGFLMAATELLALESKPTEDHIREALSGNICRCTGYQGIVEAVKELGTATQQQQSGATATDATDPRT